MSNSYQAEQDRLRIEGQRKIRYAFSLVRNAIRRHPKKHQHDAIDEIMRELQELRAEIETAKAQEIIRRERERAP